MDKGTKKDIDNIAYDILKQSKSFGVFPTPVKKIVEFSELYIDPHTGIHHIPNNYISKRIDLLEKAIKKIFGALDRRKKIIYIDPNLPILKRNFVELHEVGHDVITWQHKTFEFIEDHETLSPQTKIEFEAEANYFASASLFQLDRFEDFAQNLPLSIQASMHLSQKFGASVHATLRRYVETSLKRCALIVLNKMDGHSSELQLRDYFQSNKMSKEFGNISMPETFDISWPFVQDYIARRRFHIDGMITIGAENSEVDFDYHYFNNTYNVFILMKPVGEEIKIRSLIYVSGYDY